MENVKSVTHKKGFTLFEVIISLVIFSIVLMSLLRLNQNENNLQTYYKLQALENEYIQTGSVESTQSIKLQN